MSASRVPDLEQGDAESLYRAALALNPDVLDAHRRHMASLWGGGTLALVLKERFRLVAVSLAGCEFCSSVRFERDGERLLDDRAAAEFDDDNDPRVVAAVAYTRAFCTDPHAIDDGLRARLASVFTDDEIVELNACLATFGSFPRSVIALDLHGDDQGTIVFPVPEIEGVPTASWPCEQVTAMTAAAVERGRNTT